jgi:hypothetical protein
MAVTRVDPQVERPREAVGTPLPMSRTFDQLRMPSLKHGAIVRPGLTKIRFENVGEPSSPAP